MTLSFTGPKGESYATGLVVMDTSAFIELAKRPDWEADIAQLLSAYTLIVPTPVMYELCFGWSELVDAQQAALKSWIDKKCGPIDKKYGLGSDVLAFIIAVARGQILHAGEMYIVNPGNNEWLSARHRLLARIEAEKDKDKIRSMKNKHLLDSLIHSCARNLFAVLCTQNISDFRAMNRVAALVPHDGPIPLMTVAELLLSVEQPVVTST